MSVYDEVKERVRAENDIVEVVSNYVSLKKSGRNYMGLCPFHSEKTPSFNVKPDSQFFYCFGCHAGGDVFTFISKIENMTFNESLKFLAERANIKLPENNNFDNSQNKLKDKMFAIYADSTLFYHERLYKPIAKVAQDYVRKRKLNSWALEQFKIGYSGVSNELYNYLHNKGYSDKDIEVTELCLKGKDGKYYDFFRNRLMFPIMNISGKVMAFGARKLEEDGNPRNPKYLNSRDSLIFKKRENLFALNFAKKEDIKYLLLVEGNMDVISLHLRGIRTTVASLGTAFTIEQARLISRYTDNVILSYDSDSAGQKAILAADEILEKVRNKS